MNHFIIAIGSRNNSQWVESNIGSILSQDYQNYEVMYFDDASDDDTFEKVKKMVGNDIRFKLYKSNIRKYKTYFYSEYLNKFQDNFILVFLDGDDMLYCENVLSYLDELYNKTGCWMTYGGMLVWNGNESITEPYPQNSEIPPHIIETKAYRKDIWRTSHLKSMRTFIWNALDKTDLCPDGKYMVGPDDLAIMFGALEICPPEKVHRIQDHIYLYNHSEKNQYSRAFNDNKANKINYETKIRERTPYETISFVTPTLAGGLGNQMFEIAAAASLAKDNKAVLIVNNEEHFLPNQGRNVNNYSNNIFRKIVFNNNLYVENIYRQDTPIYNPIPYQKNLKLIGHFQSYKYFNHNQEYIQNLFNPNENLIQKSNNITAIQVRRGDYFKFPNHHPQLPVEYFYKAVELANTKHIVIYSDDIPWCKTNLKFNGIKIDYSTEESDWKEMIEMSTYQNLIISNSSFGWWAAYLNQHPQKKIYVPSMWFGPAIQSQGFNINDLILPMWNIVQL